MRTTDFGIFMYFVVADVFVVKGGKGNDSMEMPAMRESSIEIV
jgi:hypothetical protein